MSEQSQNLFIENFKTKLDEVKNKEHLIENEITQIIAFTSVPDKDPNFMGDLNFANETNSVFDFMDMGNPVYFNSAFNEYLLNGKITPVLYFEEDDESPVEDDSFKEEQEYAIAFVNYYLWLKELKANPNKKKITSNLSHKQKMLALHYLGLDLSKYDNTKSAKILSQVLDLNEENTRKYLSYLSGGNNKVTTKQNLERLLSLFEDDGFKDIKTEIITDLESIK